MRTTTELQRREVLCTDRCSRMSPAMINRTPNAISYFPYRRGHYVLSALCTVGLISLVLVTACRRAPQASKPTSSGGEWLDFQGTWTAVGIRNSMHLSGDRRASISIFNGSLVLAGPSRPGLGFRSEAILFSDTATGMVGRAVWTDETGDQAYSELRGEGTADNNKITGTFVGGTGRYSGVIGTYEFSWRFVLQNEEGAVQGQSTGLKGRVRLGSQQAGAAEGAPRS